MKIAVTLESGADNEIDRTEIDVPDDDDAIGDAVSQVLDGWTLQVGDIVRVIDVEVRS